MKLYMKNIPTLTTWKNFYPQSTNEIHLCWWQRCQFIVVVVLEKHSFEWKFFKHLLRLWLHNQTNQYMMHNCHAPSTTKKKNSHHPRCVCTLFYHLRNTTHWVFSWTSIRFVQSVCHSKRLTIIIFSVWWILFRNESKIVRGFFFVGNWLLGAWVWIWWKSTHFSLIWCVDACNWREN